VARAARAYARGVRVTLVRHATLLVELGGLRLLVDPMLDPAGARPPIAGTPNPMPNPLVELPVASEDVVADVDAVVVTHLHTDHLDESAIRLVPRHVPTVCQPPDVERLRGHGFERLVPVDETAELGALRIARHGGRHGTGELAERLAPVSGFVLDGPEGRLQIAGDTVWCDELAVALHRHRPDVVVLNAGGARFLEGDPITMTAADVVRVAAAAPHAQLVAVHLEAINHCLERRPELRERTAAAGVEIAIPDDGETLDLERRRPASA
jgi:L-ascorbate metabolism protein UlaG (beta-lactamase superfamily)